MRENGQHNNILNILTGQNGASPEEIENVEPAEMERSLEDAINRAATKNLTDEDAFLISAVSHHVDGGLFQRVARRRGSSWRTTAALADRIVQFEGLAKIHLEIAFQTENMDLALALKIKSFLDRLDLIKKNCDQMEPDSRDIMYQGLAMAKERGLRVWEKAPNDFLRDASRRLGVDYYD